MLIGKSYETAVTPAVCVRHAPCDAQGNIRRARRGREDPLVEVASSLEVGRPSVAAIWTRAAQDAARLWCMT